jgi:hypothetical protein
VVTVRRLADASTAVTTAELSISRWLVSGSGSLVVPQAAQARDATSTVAVHFARLYGASIGAVSPRCAATTPDSVQICRS